MAQAQMTQAQAAQAAAQANAAARGAVLGNSIEALALIFSQSAINPASQSVVNVTPRNVGLIRGFYVHIGAVFTTGITTTLNKTTMGPANLLSLVTFNDLSNQQRINCQGWYLPFLDSQRRRNQSFSAELATGVPASAASGTDTPLGMSASFTSNFASSGINTPIMSCPATIAPSQANQTIDMWYYIPISYTDRDLRGAIYAGVVNSVMNLQLTFNNASFQVASTADPTLAVFQSTGAVNALTAQTWSVEVYQDFLDQLPFSSQGPILPFQDLSWSYLLNTTFFTGMTVGGDYPIPFPNFRNIQSVTVGYDNGGSMNGGTDINTLSLQSANYTNIFKVSPAMAAILTRNIMHVDMPKGLYYFDFRRKPLSTVQYGNLNLIVNPATVTSTLGASQFIVGFEQLAMQNQVVGAGSMAGG
jgi:P3 major capsid protein